MATELLLLLTHFIHTKNTHKSFRTAASSSSHFWV